MKRNLIISILLALLLGVFNLHISSLNAQSSEALELYTDVWMYQLTPSGAIREPDTLCMPGDTNWGCTAFCDNIDPDYNPYCERARTLGYPSSYINYTATTHIEHDYLLDVVTQEMSPQVYKEPAALRAQVVAARSFAHYFVNNPPPTPYPPYNNSSENYQVFVPYRFDALNPTEPPIMPGNDACGATNLLNAAQLLVCEAVEPHQFIALEGYDIAARADFSADIFARTETADKTYLIAVDDPISTGCGAVTSGNGYGFSQQGANRWARGNQCARPVLGDIPWSVRWQHFEQILVHYYTDIHLRDGDDVSIILTPDWRWNPLRIDWGTSNNEPPSLWQGDNHPIEIKVQNTGVSEWVCGASENYRLGYRWMKGELSEIGSSYADLCGVLPGDPSPLTTLSLDVPNWGSGAYKLYFDVYVDSDGDITWFSDLGWFPYTVSLCIDGPCQIFLPVVYRDFH